MRHNLQQHPRSVHSWQAKNVSEIPSVWLMRIPKITIGLRRWTLAWQHVKMTLSVCMRPHAGHTYRRRCNQRSQFYWLETSKNKDINCVLRRSSVSKIQLSNRIACERQQWLQRKRKPVQWNEQPATATAVRLAFASRQFYCSATDMHYKFLLFIIRIGLMDYYYYYGFNLIRLECFIYVFPSHMDKPPAA